MVQRGRITVAAKLDRPVQHSGMAAQGHRVHLFDHRRRARRSEEKAEERYREEKATSVEGVSMFTLSLQRNSIGDDLTRLVERIANPGNAQKRGVSGAIRQGFQDNFTTQGAASGERWQPLAQRTVASRRKLGWGATGPILVRRGVLRDTWVNAGGQGHVSNVRQSAGMIIFEEGAEGEIPAVHELGAVIDIPAMQQSRKNGMMHVGGARQVTIPARPVSLLGERSEARIMDVIDLMIDQIQAQAVGR